MPTPRQDERGLALVSVLWALSILSLIAAAMLTSGILSLRMERNGQHRLEAQLLAESAVQRAILGITDAREDKRWRIDGISQEFAVGDARVRVRVQDEFGKIDINSAKDDLLKGLFRSVGVAPDQVDMLTNEIVYWRTANNPDDPHNVKAPQSGIASVGYRPRDGAFQSIDELKLIAGMTPALFARIEHAITVFSKQPDINQQMAPKEALLAVPGMDAQKADTIIAERINPADAATQTNGTKMGMLDTTIPPSGRVFSIAAEVRDQQQRVTKQQAVVQLTGDKNRPYYVLDWR